MLPSNVAVTMPVMNNHHLFNLLEPHAASFWEPAWGAEYLWHSIRTVVYSPEAAHHCQFKPYSTDMLYTAGEW